MNEQTPIAFIYRIDYKGEHPLIKGTSYGGSKKITEHSNWERYYGSPSTRGCAKCEAWKTESRTSPHLFEKSIIEYVYEGESISEKEAAYLKSVSPDIRKDPKWINNAIPRKGAFPEFVFTGEEMEKRQQKIEQTYLEKTGHRLARIFVDSEYRKQCVLKKYGVENINQLPEMREKISRHRKEYFSNLTPEQRKQHGQKSLQNRKPENVERGTRQGRLTKLNFSQEKKQDIESRRKAKWDIAVANMTPEKKQSISDRCKFASNFLRSAFYLTLEFQDGRIESDFKKDWVAKNLKVDKLIASHKKGTSEFLEIAPNIYARLKQIEKKKRIDFDGDKTFIVLNSISC